MNSTNSDLIKLYIEDPQKTQDLFMYIISGVIGLLFTVIQIQIKRFMKINHKELSDLKETQKLLKNDIETISRQTSERQASERSNIVDIENQVNEPITPRELTHRDINLSNGNIIRIHQK